MSPDSHTDARSLDAILTAQTELFAELTEIVRGQRQALLDADLPTLKLFSDRAETLAHRFEILESERQRHEDSGALNDVDADTRERAERALAAFMHETAISGTVFTRMSDTTAARHAAVASMFGSSYLADGRAPGLRAAGVSLSKEA